MASEQPVVRSISLPSREHPCSVRIEALLKHLNSFQSPFSESLAALQSSLASLAELYACVDELVNSPAAQHAIVEVGADFYLEGSITLLDTCNAARETLLTMTQHAQALQSAMRRKCLGQADVNAYLRFRRKAKKAIIAECLAGLKRMESNNSHVAVSDSSTITGILFATSSVTVYVLRSLLKFLSGNPSNKGWSLLSKLTRKTATSSESLVAGVDASVHALVGTAHSGDDVARSRAVVTCQEMLETLNSSSDDLMSEVERVFRCLLRNRVSLLNILTR